MLGSSDNQVKLAYPQQITEDAKNYGFKAANLSFLDNIIREFESDVKGVSASVPQFIPINHQVIKKHLDTHAPQWQKQWEEFCATFEAQSQKNALEAPSQKKLEEIRQTISACFKDHPLSPEYMQLAGIDPTALSMVRSTGREDSTEMANPGGNESLPAFSNPNAISNALGEVIASYFGEKSISQRLKAGDNITQDPFIPALVQVMIGEGLNSTKAQSVVVSGVIYTDRGSSRIQVAPGHGELVVNSKGNYDSYYVTPQNMVYPEVRAKHMRMKAQLNSEGRKVELVPVENPQPLKANHSLDPDAALYIHQLAQFIEKKYGMRMDIEFVYDGQSKNLHIVQARNIPLGSRKGVAPSAIAPELMDRVENPAKAQEVITPDTLTAIVITDPKQVISQHSTIGPALSEFLNDKEGKSKVVLVKQTAPPTSHEAGEFNSKGIPVLVIEQDARAKELIATASPENPIVIDPQRRLVCAVPKGIKVEEFIKEGIYRSLLTPYVSPHSNVLKAREVERHPEAERQASKDINFGEALLKARAGDAKATTQLLEYVYENVVNYKGLAHPYKYKNGQAVRGDLNKLSAPQIGGDNRAAKATLSNLCRYASRKAQSGEIKPGLYQQMMLNAGEMYNLLDRLEKPEQAQAALFQYLNAFAKFEGSIVATAQKDVLLTSVADQTAEKRHRERADKLMAGVSASAEDKEYFYELLKLEKFGINENIRKDWEGFCLDVCLKQKKGAELDRMVSDLQRFGLHEMWVNRSFVDAKKAHGSDSVQAFNALQSELSTALQGIEPIKEAQQRIQMLNSQVSNWSDPKNFDKLYANFQKECKAINGALQYNAQDPELKRLLVLEQVNEYVDIFDRTLKAVQTSGAYEDKKAQVANFKTLLQDFHDLQKIWIKNARFWDNRQVVPLLDKKLKEATKLKEENELSPSADFAVIFSTIDKVGHPEARDGLHGCKSLADIHTLIHQNLLVCIGKITRPINENLHNQYPVTLKKLVDGLKDDIKVTSHNTKDEVGKVDLLASQLKYPHLILHYNIPLRHHSGHMEIKYDYRKDRAEISYMLFFGVSQDLRQEPIQIHSQALLEHLFNFKIIEPPHCNTTTGQFKFTVEVNNQEQIPSLLYVLQRNNLLTFETIDEKFFSSSNYQNLQRKALYESPLNQLKSMVEYLSKTGNTNTIIKEYLTRSEYILGLRSQGFDINQYLAKYPEVAVNPNLSELFNHAIKNFSSQLNYKMRKDENSFSLEEQILQQKDIEALSQIDANSLAGNKFVLFSILKPMNKMYEALEQSSEISLCWEKCQQLIESRAKFQLRDTQDWHDLSKSIHHQGYRQILLDLITPKSCTPETLHQILYMELYDRSSFFRQDQHRAFAEALAKPYGIKIDSVECKKEMLKVAEKIEKNEKAVSRLRTEINAAAAQVSR
jgi:hypothetical protein